MITKEIIQLIENEIQYQKDKWGDSCKQDIAGYLLIMQSELQEAIQGWMKNKTGRDSVLSEIIQLMAIGIRCLDELKGGLK